MSAPLQQSDDVEHLSPTGTQLVPTFATHTDPASPASQKPEQQSKPAEHDDVPESETVGKHGDSAQ